MHSSNAELSVESHGLGNNNQRKTASNNARFLMNLMRQSRKLLETNDTFLHQHNPDIINMEALSSNAGYNDAEKIGRTPGSLFQNRVVINVGGVRFETFKSTLEIYPETLLGNPKRRKYFYDDALDEYFFDRHRESFEAILYYYQSKGRIRRPNAVPLDTFLEEITFFDLGPDALAQVRRDENLTELEKSPLPRNRLRRYIWATMEYPEFSFIAQVVNVLVLITVLVSTITLAIESLPQFSHYSEEECNRRYQQHQNAMKNESADFSNVQSRGTMCISYFSSPFHIIQTICVIIFTVELILRLISTPSLPHYLKGFMNWIDILSVVPFYFSIILYFLDRSGDQNVTLVNGLSLLRVLRCARIFKFYRVFKNVKTIRVLAVTVSESMTDFLILAAILTLLSFLFGAAIYLIEGSQGQFDSIPKATYWGVVTITSVGYGDITPVTALGRLVAIVCAFSGVGTIGMLVSVLVDRYQRVYTRKLYIKPEKIDFKAYQEADQDDVETKGYGNSCLASLVVNVDDRKSDVQQVESYSLSPPRSISSQMVAVNPEAHSIEHEDQRVHSVSQRLLNRVNALALRRQQNNSDSRRNSDTVKNNTDLMTTDTSNSAI